MISSGPFQPLPLCDFLKPQQGVFLLKQAEPICQDIQSRQLLTQDTTRSHTGRIKTQMQLC